VAVVKIIWTRQALEDLAEARAYVEDTSPQAVATVEERLEHTLKMLRIDPMNTTKSWYVEGTREIAVDGTFFIFVLRMRGIKVEILGLLHLSRPWPAAA
jgi:plasmid stabilization system protein ParE